MSLYQVQKLLRDVNRDISNRERYMQNPETFAEGYDLTPEERAAILDLDYGALYAMGVHALILRPFSLLHKEPEPRYLEALRASRVQQPAGV